MKRIKKLLKICLFGCVKFVITLKTADLPMRTHGVSKSKMPCTYCPIKKECYAEP
jgi:hypothetical protein